MFETARALREVGTENLCVGRAVNKAADPVAAIGQLQEIWKKNTF